MELFAHVPGWSVELVGPSASTPVASAQGVCVLPHTAYDDILTRQEGVDILLLPGGFGARRLVQDETFLALLRTVAEKATLVTSVCTGSGLLAAAGVLDGFRATSNKASWNWATSQSGPVPGSVTWVSQARWVVDGNRWTSSGVAAGMDMAHALISDLVGDEMADCIADDIELEVHRDQLWDPFAAVHGVV